MIDIKLLQKDFDNVANALKRKGVAQEILDTKQFSRLIYRNKPLD